ncbi:MAG: gliding motility-associated C-terminal domain-containing protein [Fluviicola sp.]|nr:gliding motility-associated C-terminal domain-containing protein [Fluviicola sp.]
MKPFLRLFSFFLLFLPAQLSAQYCPDSCTYFIPNTLTPDCDQAGCEILQIVSNCTFPKFDFTLYNRWGDPIFHSNDPNVKFDCTDSQDGVYTWVFIATYCNSISFSDTGLLHVIK